ARWRPLIGLSTVSPDVRFRDMPKPEGGGRRVEVMNLNDIIQSAQGGAGLQNLGGAFGLTPEQTQAAVQAIIPALSHGLQRAAQNHGALGGVISEMASGAHAGSYVDPAQTGAAVDAGSGALGQIFGGPAVTSEIANQIS